MVKFRRFISVSEVQIWTIFQQSREWTKSGIGLSLTAAACRANGAGLNGASFTPDQKYIVFRSDMFGPTYAFAVEVAKAQ